MMNFQTLTPSAKTYKMMQTLATGQMVTSREVANIAILAAIDISEHKTLIDSVAMGIKSKGGCTSVHSVPSFGFLNKINPMTAKFAESFKATSAGSAEAIIKSNLVDGVVIVADCDITAAGLLMGAARANCPALVLPTGISLFTDDNNGEISSLHIAGAVASGRLNKMVGEQLVENTVFPPPSPNMFCSISTFFILLESIGLTVPNCLNKTKSVKQYEAATRTGEQIVASAANLLTPKKFLVRDALSNATCLCLAIGGSIAAITSLANLVRVFENKTPVMITELAAKTPLLFKESSQNCHSLIKAGGVAAVFKQLSSVSKLINDSALTYNGEKLKNALAEIKSANLETVHNTARIVTLKGTACEDGGFVHVSSETPVSHSGKAWVYLTLEDADKALLSGNIPDGSVIVLHNCVGVNISAITYAIEGMGKAGQIAVLTDGISEPTSVLTVTSICPTSYDNESFANIQNGDTIDIDLGKGRLNTSAVAKEIKTRAKRNSTKKAPIYFS